MKLTLLTAFCFLHVKAYQDIIAQVVHSRPSCLLVILGMAPDFIKSLMERFEPDTGPRKSVVVNDRYTAEMGKEIWDNGCLIGLSPISHEKALQEILLPSNERQLIAVNTNETNQLVDFDVHKHHHPVLVLDKEHERGRTVQKVACKGNPRHLIVNMLTRQDTWLLHFKASSMDLERYCNNGKHPLHGTHLRGSIFSVNPFIDFDAETKEIHSGVTMDLLKTLAKKFEFDFNVKLSTTWFEFWPDGSITGALGELLQDEVDFNLEQALILNHVGTFTALTYAMSFIYIEQRPKLLPLYQNIVHTLDIYTWALLGLSFFVMWFSLWLSFSKNMDKGSIKMFLLTFGVLFQEYHSVKKPNAHHLLTMLTFVWVAATTFISMALVGNLKSSLVKNYHEERTKSLNEIVDKDMPIHITTTMEDYLEAGFAVSELNSRLLCQARKTDLIFTINQTHYFKQMYEPVLEHGGASAMIQQATDVLHDEYLKHGKDFPLVVIPERYFTMFHGILFQKYDVRARYFGYEIESLKELGLMDHYFKNWTPMKDIKDSSEVHNEPLILEHFILPLMICSAGLVIALVFFVWEVTTQSTRLV